MKTGYSNNENMVQMKSSHFDHIHIFIALVIQMNKLKKQLCKAASFKQTEHE